MLEVSQNHDSNANEFLPYWAKMGRWDLHEAAILSLGGDPKIITIEGIQKARRTDKYDDRVETIKRAIKGRKLNHDYWESEWNHKYYLNPLDFVRWAKQFDINIPEELAEKVFLYHKERDFKSLYEQEAATSNVLKEEVNSLKQEISRGNLKEKPLHTKEKETLLKIIAAITVDAYGYDPSQKMNKSLADIRSALDQIGCALDDDTIRNKLQQSEQFIPLEFLENKPK